MYAERSLKGVLEASKLHFGSILKGLGGVCGGFGEGLERVLGGVWSFLASLRSLFGVDF